MQTLRKYFFPSHNDLHYVGRVVGRELGRFVIVFGVDVPEMV
jgi:hypothetical protein